MNFLYLQAIVIVAVKSAISRSNHIHFILPYYKSGVKDHLLQHIASVSIAIYTHGSIACKNIIGPLIQRCWLFKDMCRKKSKAFHFEAVRHLEA